MATHISRMNPGAAAIMNDICHDVTATSWVRSTGARVEAITDTPAFTIPTDTPSLSPLTDLPRAAIINVENGLPLFLRALSV